MRTARIRHRHSRDIAGEMWYNGRTTLGRTQTVIGGTKMFFKKVEEFKKVVREIEIARIRVEEDRVRRIVPDAALASLADSIARHGVIEPVLVRSLPCQPDGTREWSLIAGERRLRAAKMCGLSTLPAIAIEATQTEAAVLAIIENIHREDLNFFEEAFAIRSLIALAGITQDACAKRLSVSQSYVANKLRLLRLTAAEQEWILRQGLTERHARAVLRIPDEAERTQVLKIFAERQLNVASAEEYVESILCAAERSVPTAPPEIRQKIIVKDIRLFYNSIDHAVDVIKKCGIPVSSSRREIPEGTLIEILLPKREPLPSPVKRTETAV